MEAFQGNSQLDDQQHHHLDSRLQSDPSIDTDEVVVQALAQEFEDLVLSCKHEGFDRDLQGYSDVIDDEDHMKQGIDDELRHLELKEDVNEAFEAESSNGAEEKNQQDVRRFVDEVIERHVLKKAIEADPEECRVLEAREIFESEIGCENQEEEVDDADDDDDDKVFVHDEEELNENHEIEIADGDGGNEIGGFESNGEERRSEGGNYKAYEHVEDLENESDGILKSYHYPVRPDAEDCSYYMRTGMCKYGSNCKFNHPLRRKHQQPSRDSQKQKEENMEMHGQIECKYYLSPLGCKYGESCKFIHGRGKPAITPVLEYNFLGLPIRLGEKECPYYMRNGSCKYGPGCRFNHPDPGAIVSVDAPAGYGNDGPLPPQPNIPNMTSWSGPRTPDPSSAFVPMMYPPTQNMPPPNPDWNGYQGPAHVYPSSERGLPIPPAFYLNNLPSDTNMYTHHHQQPPMVVSEYPERPGQPECSYFMKTGDCKYRASCKFHHPKSRIARTAPSVLSDKGLPLRPDQNICTYYSRYGICKYGPACKYDHPVNYSMNSGEGGYDGSGRSGPLIQQSV